MSDNLYNLLAPRPEPQRIYGVVTGVVTNNEDPQGLGRVKVAFPWLSEEIESDWARIAAPMAGKERGLYLLPEVDDEVLVAFEHGDMRHPYILGGLWSEPQLPPATNDDGKNNLRTMVSRSGMTITFDDTDGAEQLVISDKDKKNSLVIDVANQTITLSADSDITIATTNGKLTLKGKGVAINSQAEVKIEASAGLELKAGGQMKLKGATIDLN